MSDNPHPVRSTLTCPGLVEGAIKSGDKLTFSLAKPAWWRFMARRRWRKMRGPYWVSGVTSGQIALDKTLSS